MIVLGLPAVAVGALGPATDVSSLEVSGNARTRTETIERLLPEGLPAPLDDEQLTELDRRLRNLGIFDAVTVSRRGNALLVDVREKWTLTPSFDLSTGETAVDTNVSAGLTEANALGTGHSVSVTGGFADRGPFANLELEQHPYARGAWAHGMGVGFEAPELRFGPDGGEATGRPDDLVWRRTAVWAGYFARPTATYDSFLRFGAGPFVSREWYRAERGSGADVPAPSSWVGLTLAAWIDAFTFDDLVPTGALISFEVSPAVGPRRRAQASLETQLAAAPASFLGVLANVVGEAVTAGDPNNSLLLGSQRGVRGLPDGVLRTRAHLFANVETRASLRIADRWALQAVAFADGAVFQRLEDGGSPGDSGRAFSSGLGARVVPTWLAGLLFRIDLARLWLPERDWLLQVGAGQYF